MKSSTNQETEYNRNMSKRIKTAKEQCIEIQTGPTIEQWEENNKKLEPILKKQNEKKRKLLTTKNTSDIFQP
jgi:hypothetical protein